MMNRKMRRMFGGLAAASFLAAGFVYAQGWQASDTNRRFQNQQQSDQGTGVGRLFRSDVQEAQVGVLMELTGQTNAKEARSYIPIACLLDHRPSHMVTSSGVPAARLSVTQPARMP